MSQQWVGLIAVFMLALLGMLSAWSLLHFTTYHDEYRFGTEVSSWRYTSIGHFVSLGSVELILSVIGIVLSVHWLPKAESRSYLILPMAILVLLVLSAVVL